MLQADHHPVVESHRVATAVLAAILVALAPWITTLPMRAQILLLTVGVAFLGVPHGALDHLIARPWLAPLVGRAWLPVFGAGYLALTGLVLMAWIRAPHATLLAFLVTSIIHFGLDAGRGMKRLRTIEVLAYGGAPIVLPCWLHSEMVAPVFTQLVDAGGPVEASQLQGILAIVGPTWTVAACITTIGYMASNPRSLRSAAELAGLVGLFVALPPLLAFTAYFCLIHSARHLIEIGLQLAPQRGSQHPTLDRWKWLAAQAIPLTILTIVLALVLAPRMTEGLARDPALLRIIFWGLSALTVPHMLLLLLRGNHCPPDIDLDSPPSEDGLPHIR